MKNELYIPLIIFALTLVFGIICLMVYLSGGNTYWIKKKLKIGALLLTFNGIIYGTNAQDEASCYLAPGVPSKSLIGVSYFYSRVNHLNPTPNSSELDDETYLYDGISSGFSIGINYEYIFGNPYESLSSIICNIKYDSKPRQLGGITLLYAYKDTEKGEMYEYTVVDVDYSFSFITAEVLYKQNFFNYVPIGITVGPYFSLPIDLNARESINKGINVKDSIFNSQHDMKITYNGTIKNAKPIDIGIVAGIQYQIIFDMDIFIVPSFTYRFSLSGIQYETDWNITSFDYGISIRCRF